MNDKSTIEDRQEKDKKAIIEALKEMPIIAVACKRSGISRATYYRWRKDDKQFMRQIEDAINQGFELINDLSEGQIVTLIKEKKMPAISLWLKHHHPRYGHQVKSYKPIATAEELNPEEQKIVSDALALAAGINTNSNNDDGNQPTASGENPRESKDQTTLGI